jgi:hypothetical protein
MAAQYGVIRDVTRRAKNSQPAALDLAIGQIRSATTSPEVR